MRKVLGIDIGITHFACVLVSHEEGQWKVEKSITFDLAQRNLMLAVQRLAELMFPFHCELGEYDVAIETQRLYTPYMSSMLALQYSVIAIFETFRTACVEHPFTGQIFMVNPRDKYRASPTKILPRTPAVKGYKERKDLACKTVEEFHVFDREFSDHEADAFLCAAYVLLK